MKKRKAKIIVKDHIENYFFSELYNFFLDKINLLNSINKS